MYYFQYNNNYFINSIFMSNFLVLSNLPETAVVYEAKRIKDTTYYLNNLDVIVKDNNGEEIRRSRVNDDRIDYLRDLIRTEANMKESNRKAKEDSLRYGELLRRARIIK